MNRFVWSVLCARSIIDSETNNISLLNVIEQISVAEEPVEGGFIPGDFELVSFWTRNQDNQPLRTRIRLIAFHPSGSELGVWEAMIDLSQHRRSRHRMKFSGMPADTPGTYLFVTQQWDDGRNNWKTESEIPLSVSFVPAPAEEGSETQDEAATVGP